MTPTWYDVLDVDPAAAPEEIRAAWRAAIADLSPGDRRFRVANEAAEVLLDPVRRADYDADLAASAPLSQEPDSAADAEGDDPEPAPEPLAVRDEYAGERDEVLPPPPPPPAAPPSGPAAARTGRDVPVWLLAVVAVVTAAMVTLTAWTWLTTTSDAEISAAAGDAQRAAEEAIVPVLSYDGRTLEEDRAAARAYLTDDFAEEYDRLFDGIVQQNAPELGTRVEWEVLGSGLVRTGEDRAQIFLFLDQSVTNLQQTEPVVYRNHVTVTMARIGDDWLVDGLSTTPQGG